MKRVIFGLIATVFMSVSSVNAQSLDQYFGFHNNALNAIMKDIESNEAKYVNSNDPTSIAFDFYKNYVKSNFKSTWSNEDVSKFLNEFKSFNYKNNNKFIELTNNSYYKNLLTIIDSETKIEVVQSKIDNLIFALEKDTKITEVDKIALKAAMLIGKESSEFWNKNGKKAALIRTKLSVNSTSSKVTNKYLKADIEGAIGGAITGAFTGGPAGAAIGAMLGAPWSSAVSGFFDRYVW